MVEKILVALTIQGNLYFAALIICLPFSTLISETATTSTAGRASAGTCSVNTAPPIPMTTCRKRFSLDWSIDKDSFVSSYHANDLHYTCFSSQEEEGRNIPSKECSWYAETFISYMPTWRDLAALRLTQLDESLERLQAAA